MKTRVLEHPLAANSQAVLDGQVSPDGDCIIRCEKACRRLSYEVDSLQASIVKEEEGLDRRIATLDALSVVLPLGCMALDVVRHVHSVLTMSPELYREQKALHANILLCLKYLRDTAKSHELEIATACYNQDVPLRRNSEENLEVHYLQLWLNRLNEQSYVA